MQSMATVVEGACWDSHARRSTSKYCAEFREVTGGVDKGERVNHLCENEGLFKAEISTYF